jgi:CRP/FNR family cyclic AMP-dependent transcriptional regulator
MNDVAPFPGSQTVAEPVSVLIRKTDFFSGFDSAEISILSNWIQALAFPAGTFILQEGNNDEGGLCVLLEGMVDVYRKTEPDKHLKIATIRPGETIGEMGVVDGQPFSASVIATQDSVLLMISRGDFDRLTEQHERIGVKLLRKIAVTISKRLRKTTGRLADLLANK